jgi:hypothetical protein
MAREPGQPDGCPKKAATFLAMFAACVLAGHRLGRALAVRYDRRT